MAKKRQTKRYEYLDSLEINKESFIREDASIGLSCMNSPNDPKPSIKIKDGRIVEMDGKKEEDFDVIDKFIARYSIDISIAEEAMAIDSTEFARRMVDINVPRSEIVKYAGGMTPAKVCEIVTQLNAVEMMMAMQKIRARRTPGNQGHVCNRKEDPALLAADTAIAAAMGFQEIETTLTVARMAPSTALGVLIGSQIGQSGCLTQCAVEEGVELEQGMRGFTTYAETLSVYGTEEVYRQGDDLPWSKMFLTAAYCSRGIKNRFTSGGGSECLMGYPEGKSMLYLEARCIASIRGAGCQGIQNGGIDCVYFSNALPMSQINTMAENIIVAMWDLECASGCDGFWSGSYQRNTSHMIPWMITGTDYIHSGVGTIHVRDNNFGGSGFNLHDLDNEIAIQRDFRVDCALRSIDEDEWLEIRRKAAKAMQILCEQLDFPTYTDEEIEKVIFADSSDDIERNPADNIAIVETIEKNHITLIDVIKAFAKAGEMELANLFLELMKKKLSGDLLQTAAMYDRNFQILSAINNGNDYEGPGTGYRVDGDRWEEIKEVRQIIDEEDMRKLEPDPSLPHIEVKLTDVGPAAQGTDPNEVIVGLSPAFAGDINVTLANMTDGDILYEGLAGIEEEGMKYRIVRVENEIDLGMIAKKCSMLSGSGIAVCMQAKGTTVIHQKDLTNLNNLELLPMAPLITLPNYRSAGKNAAMYAKGETPEPIVLDWNYDTLVAKTRAFPKVVVMNQVEKHACHPDKDMTEVSAEFVK